MKKFLFIALAAFALFSCNKIEEEVVVENEPQSLRYIFSVADKPSFDVDTKAVKTSWEEGDLIYIVFDNQLPTSLNDFMILEYKTNDWIVKQESANPPKTEGGTLDALYYEGTELNPYLDEGEFFINALLDDFGKYMYLNSNDVPYTIKDGVLESSLSLDFDSEDERTYVQFCITGLIGDDWAFYREDVLASENSFNLWAPTWKNGSFGHYCISQASFDYQFSVREDGHYIYLSTLQKSDKITITLVKTEGVNAGKYQKTFSKKISGKCVAITFKGPQFNDSGECTNGWERLDEQINNVIYYTSSNGGVVIPYATDVFGANIVSNTYENGQGIITFDGVVTNIGETAFFRCSNLASITIPETVTSIEDKAFYLCINLTSITIPNSVKSFGFSTFYGCDHLTSVTLPNSVTSIGDAVFESCYNLTSINIPGSVTSIGRQAFDSCLSLASIEIPDSVKSIEIAAFWNCSSLTSITIPGSVTKIGNQAFRACSSLESIIVDADNPVYDSRENCNAIIETKTNTLLFGCSSTVIPNSVTSIEQGAFESSKNLTSIIIPESVKSIGGGAFYKCRNLVSVCISDSGTRILDSAFEGCRSLTSIVVNAKTPPVGGNNMFYDTNNCPIYVPLESVETYKIATYWSEYADRIQAIQEINGHAYVDMGNGLKWATMNIGSSSPDNYGDYFAWGETSSKEDYSWDTYKWGLSTSLTRYVTSETYGTVDDKTSFADYNYADDAARANWGATWRTPTDAEWTWLRTNCVWTWKTTDDGFATNGYLVTATNGNSIFLPAAGAWDGVSLINASSNGYYWSSSLLEFFPSSALSVLFGSKDIGTKQLARFNGLPVRPVSE